MPDKDLRKSIHAYWPKPQGLRKLERDTILWYPGKQEIAGLFLKNRIPLPARELALTGFRQMEWITPKRAETKTAVSYQKGNTVTPGELLFGHIDRGSIEQTKVTLAQGVAFACIAPILLHMTNIFARALPKYFGQQNRPFSDDSKWAAYHKKDESRPEYGGIPTEVRAFLTAFSSVTLLRSCPASLHKDGGNARKDQTSFTALTSVGDGEFSGGAFSLIEYGLEIPVKPGDLLLAQTHREWHLNLSPVKGVKYSMVAYFRRNLANPKMWETKRKRAASQLPAAD